MNPKQIINNNIFYSEFKAFTPEKSKKTMSDKVQIKILSFKQFRIPNQPENNYFGRGDYILNIIIYSPNKLLKFLDKPLQELNKKDQLFIAKCNNETSLGYAVKNCKIGIKSILISDKEFNEELVVKIFKNQQDFNNEQKVKFWMYVPVVEDVNHKYFHQERIELITCDQAKMIKLIEQNVNKAQNAAEECRSVTTVQSGDQQLMKNKINLNQNDQRQIIGTPASIQQQLFGNEVPGVGTYNIQQKNSRTQKGAWEKAKKELIFPKEQQANHIMKNQMKSNQIKQQIIKNSQNNQNRFEAIQNSNVPGVGQYNTDTNFSSPSVIFPRQPRSLEFPPEEKSHNQKVNII